MALPRSIPFFLTIFSLNLIGILSKNVEIDFISLQNNVGTDFSSLLKENLGTDNDLIKDAMYSQSEIELRLQHSNYTSEILCQGLVLTQQFCPFSNTLHIFTKNDEITLDEEIEDFQCDFMTNEQFSCVLEIQETQLNLMTWNVELSRVNSYEIFSCTSSESKFCFEDHMTEVETQDAEIVSPEDVRIYDQFFESFSCNRTTIPLNEAQMTISLSKELYTSQLSSSFNKSLKFLQKMMINFNFYALHSIRMLFKVSHMTLNEDSLDICSSEGNKNVEADFIIGNEIKGFHMFFDFCSDQELIGLESHNNFCSDQLLTIPLNSETISNQNFRINDIIGHLVNSFNSEITVESEEKLESENLEDRCSQQTQLLETCRTSGFLETRASTCGNGVLEEGEQCECPEGEIFCSCCSRCQLTVNSQCDGLNNECCSSECKFLTSTEMCEVGDSPQGGYCRLGSCIESNCVASGYQAFCGVEETNTCQSRCAVTDNQCTTVDPNNVLLFIRDGTLCERTAEETPFGECFRGECIVRASNVTPPPEDEPIFGSSNLVTVGAFTGMAVGLALLMILFAKFAKKPVKKGFEAGYRVVTKSRYEPSQAPQEPKPSSTANPHFQLSGAYPPSVKQKSRRNIFGRKKKKKEIEVVDTPHRSSAKWLQDRTREVFAMDEEEDNVSRISSQASGGSSSTLRRNRLSARVSKKAPPGLGWKEAEPGQGFTHYRDETL